MNYRHIYHAGSFTDVFKHVLLVGLINALLMKEKAFCFLDTHAGIARYDLFSEQAQKTQEFAEGIALLMNQPQANMPAWVLQYQHIVESMNSPTLLRYYPGSPHVVRALLRPQDKMI